MWCSERNKARKGHGEKRHVFFRAPGQNPASREVGNGVQSRKVTFGTEDEPKLLQIPF